MFDLFKNKKDLDSLEIERKLDQDLLEQMLYEFKDEDFYLEFNAAFEMAQVDEIDGELLYIDDFYFVLDHAEETADMFLYNEYRPSKKVITLIKSLRKASLSAQFALFTLFKNKKRIKKLKENVDSEVFVTIAEFKVTVCNILHEIFETYDINVYPAFRRKTRESVVFYQKQFDLKR